MTNHTNNGYQPFHHVAWGAARSCNNGEATGRIMGEGVGVRPQPGEVVAAQTTMAQGRRLRAVKHVMPPVAGVHVMPTMMVNKGGKGSTIHNC